MMFTQFLVCVRDSSGKPGATMKCGEELQQIARSRCDLILILL